LGSHPKASYSKLSSAKLCSSAQWRYFESGLHKPIDGFGSKGFSLYSQQRNTKDFWKVNTLHHLEKHGYHASLNGAMYSPSRSLLCFFADCIN
jgi:hypothetical protein